MSWCLYFFISCRFQFQAVHCLLVHNSSGSQVYVCSFDLTPKKNITYFVMMDLLLVSNVKLVRYPCNGPWHRRQFDGRWNRISVELSEKYFSTVFAFQKGNSSVNYAVRIRTYFQKWSLIVSYSLKNTNKYEHLHIVHILYVCTYLYVFSVYVRICMYLNICLW
jgi:hypothetical protein